MVIRSLDIAPVQDISAANEVLDRKDSEGQKGEHENNGDHRYFFFAGLSMRTL